MDDFVIFSQDKEWIESLMPQIKTFLSNELKLTLHPKKTSVSTIASGVDFLGWVHFPKHRVLRTVTKKRMIKNLKDINYKEEVIKSYIGLLKHGNTRKLLSIFNI